MITLEEYTHMLWLAGVITENQSADITQRLAIKRAVLVKYEEVCLEN